MSARQAADPHCVHLCVRPAGIHMGPADSRKRTAACGQNMWSIHKWGCATRRGKQWTKPPVIQGTNERHKTPRETNGVEPSKLKMEEKGMRRKYRLSRDN